MRYLFMFWLLILCQPIFSQHYSRVDTIPVKQNGQWLKMPWMGGLNHPQFSDIDLDLDSIKDLVAFDRTGNKINTFINKGYAGQVNYLHAPAYATLFPHTEDWMLLTDYNGDGKEDIFTFNFGTPSSITVYRNMATSSLQFKLEKKYLKADNEPIYVSSVGLPAIEDVDGDGDLDILMFETGGWTLNEYKNQSKELGYGLDSLLFTKATSCWGEFTEVANSCSATLATCQKFKNDSHAIPVHTETRNGGSCLLCLDMDADGDKELYLGQMACCKIALLTNGGTNTSAKMTSTSSAFPNSLPINISSFPCSYFLDINNDGKRDLIVSASSPNTSANTAVWYYENIGTDNKPVFNRKTKKLFQEEMIDIGEGASPTLFDFDNDGLTDLLLTNYILRYDTCSPTYSYGTYAYKNIGSAKKPQFELVNSDYANLSAQLPNTYGIHLTFGDVDKDGDSDMFAGDYAGFLHYFENTAITGSPANLFLAKPINYKDAKGDSIDVGSYSTPQLIDVDRDGDLDLIIGEAAGNINYYQNIGTPTTPSYSLITTSFGDIDVMKPCCTGYSVPFMYDSAGSYRLLVASEALQSYKSSSLWYYKNIDNNLNKPFTLVDSTYQKIWEGLRISVHGGDINTDGKMDLVVGNFAGGVAFYMGDTLTTSIATHPSQAFHFSIYPNPATSFFTLNIGDEKTTSKNYILKIYSLLGTVILEKQVSEMQNEVNINIPNGVYFCELSNAEFRVSKKLVVAK